MSSNDNYQNEGYSHEAWSHSFSEVTVPRPPRRATESRILSNLVRNEQPAPLAVATPATTTPKPNSAFSNPPPSINHHSITARQATSQEPLTLPEVRSKLSATAKEFVPSQNWHQEIYGPDPIHESFNGLSLQEPFDPYNVTVDSTGDLILARFNHALKVLNLNPGNMEDYLRPICEMIQNSSDTTQIVNVVIESLFEQSIQESNFRYTGARICQFLKNKLRGNPYFWGFHKIFITRCQIEYEKRNDLKNGTGADQERLRGLALFLAEIFLNVQAEAEDGSAERLNFLPVVLVDLVNTLLATPLDADVKCSCQLLKLSGSLIDDKVKNLPEECIKFEEIFSQLKTLQCSSQLTENAKFLIGSVLMLKEADWNRSSSSPPKKSTLHSFTSESNNFKAPEPVFYNRLGAPCSRTEAGLSEEEDEDGAYVLNDEEEAAFLEWQAEQDAQTGDPEAWCSNDTGYGSYQMFNDDGTDDGGMGDEMEAAYDEFLQKQNFTNSYKPPQQPLPTVHPHQEFAGYQQQPPHQQQNRLPQHFQDPQMHQVSPNSQAQLRQQISQQQNRLPYHQDQPQQPRMLPPNSQPQPHLPPNPQQNQQLPQHLNDQQHYQPNFGANDRYHYRR